ncbi:MAG TPA: excinuclease ABC subunit UvrB [bacterium]|nr:excinuclease ABC subunit UvrB [bacterium]
MNKFKLKSNFEPRGDQPQAIKTLVDNLNSKVKHQTLWGVTGSGKTFTMANVINQVQRPTLVIAHNKTLAAQLADEFRQFFPENEVHYFVSYYDYYQPEAYIPSSDTYIEKDSSINDEIERLRHAATHALLTRSDVIIVASVSCIYGIGSPEFYQSENFSFKIGEKINRREFLYKLNNLQYERNDVELKRGSYRLRGDVLEIMPAYANNSTRIEFFGDMVEKIAEIDWVNGTHLRSMAEFEVFPATHFMTPQHIQAQAISEIKKDLEVQVNEFKKIGKLLEAQRLEQRTNFDIEMIEQTGSCSGIENYSRYFDRRKQGEPSTTLIDYFPKDFLMFIDESHITVSQIGAMYEGDRSRKNKLIDYGFRLPAAYDNRPLRYPEFYEKINQVIFVSATPGEYEKKMSTAENSFIGGHFEEEKRLRNPIANTSAESSPHRQGSEGQARHLPNRQVPQDDTNKATMKQFNNCLVQQFIRPTGLLDPIVEIRPSRGQVPYLVSEIEATVKKGQRVLATTLTKRMAEELTEYLKEKNLKVAYLHSDIATLERLEILAKLRLGKFDVLVGINLLREGLDLPEVSLVAILDADKEGFLRSKTSLIQTMGRAARHSEGRVILFADVVTKSIQAAVEETTMRRKVQQSYNIEHGITPQSINKGLPKEEQEEEERIAKIDESFTLLSRKEKGLVIAELKHLMKDAAEHLEFERAAELRDQLVMLEERV